MALGYLIEPFIQIQDINGTPIVGAKIYVYKGNTSVLATTYSDFEGHLNTNPVLTDDLGNASIVAENNIVYDIEIRDANDLLLISKKNISIGDTASGGTGEMTVEAGYGIEVTRLADAWQVSVDTSLIATQEDLANKQDKLYAGANIEITNDNTINVVNRKEIAVQNPIKLERTPNSLKFYIDDDYTDQFKTKQEEVDFGGADKYISYIQQNENGVIEATVSEVSAIGDITPYTAGSNINITNHVISGKDWSSDINDAVSGKIDKVIGGAGSKTNPVYLSDANVVTPCFTEDNSVKLTPSDPIPAYFSGDIGGNIFMNAPNVGGSWPDDYAFRNSIVLGSQTNYRRGPSTKEKYDNCIFMNSYFYGAAGMSGTFSYNTLIGYNSMTTVKSESYGNTIIGQYNDVLAEGAESLYADTLIGHQNNIYGDGAATTVVGNSNEIGQHRSGLTRYPFHSIVVVGERNDYQPLQQGSCYDVMMVGFGNDISHSGGNYRNMTIGYDNEITGHCTYLIGDALTANNEGSYSDKVMKIGFGACHLEIHSNGIIYKVVNGTKTQL